MAIFPHQIASVRSPAFRFILVGIIAAVLVLVLLPQLMNPFLLFRHDSLLHASIANGILIGGIPPDNPMMAGKTLVYPWFHDAMIAAISAVTGILPLYIWPVWSSILATGLVLIMSGIARSLQLNTRASAFVPILAFFGVNAFGSLFVVVQTSQLALPRNVGEVLRSVTWFSDARLGGLLTKFWVANPFPLAILLYLAVIYLVMPSIEFAVRGEKTGKTMNRNLLLIILLVLLSGTQIVVFGAACMTVPIAASVVILRTRNDIGGKLLKLWTPFVVAIGLWLTWQVPLWHSITLSQPSIFPGMNHLKFFVANLTIPLLLLFGLILLGIFRFQLHQAKKNEWIFFVTIAVVCATFSFFHLPGHNEYKLIYLAALALSFPAAESMASLWTNHRGYASLLTILCMSTSILLFFAYIRVTERNRYRADDQDLGEWIAANTLASAVFVESPQKRFQIVPVLGQRSIFIGFTDALELWGYDRKEIGTRTALANSLVHHPDRKLSSSAGVNYILQRNAPKNGKGIAKNFRIAYQNSTYRILEVKADVSE